MVGATSRRDCFQLPSISTASCPLSLRCPAAPSRCKAPFTGGAFRRASDPSMRASNRFFRLPALSNPAQRSPSGPATCPIGLLGSGNQRHERRLKAELTFGLIAYITDRQDRRIDGCPHGVVPLLLEVGTAYNTCVSQIFPDLDVLHEKRNRTYAAIRIQFFTERNAR